MNGWIGVDLDGTLAWYDGWKGPSNIGEPIPVMVNRVKQWIAQGREVRILTARVCAAQKPEDREAATAAVNAWCEKHLGLRLPLTSEKDWGMVELWDDRCVQLIPNTGVRADGGR